MLSNVLTQSRATCQQHSRYSVPSMATLTRRERHDFAPVGGNDAGTGSTMRVEGIVFDMDGTLCKPQ